MPALSGPALGFLAVAAALGAREPDAGGGHVAPPAPGLRSAPDRGFAPAPRPAPLSALRAPSIALGALALVAAAAVLGLPYLAVREVSVASDLRQSDPARALRDLSLAARLDPLSADPGRLAGTIALASGRYATARQRFGQAISRDPGGWYAWLGSGLAASAAGDRAAARHDFETAAAINPGQPVIRRAMALLDTPAPLSVADALRLLAQPV